MIPFSSKTAWRLVTSLYPEIPFHRRYLSSGLPASSSIRYPSSNHDYFVKPRNTPVVAINCLLFEAGRRGNASLQYECAMEALHCHSQGQFRGSSGCLIPLPQRTNGPLVLADVGQRYRGGHIKRLWSTVLDEHDIPALRSSFPRKIRRCSGCLIFLSRRSKDAHVRGNFGYNCQERNIKLLPTVPNEAQ